MNPVHGIYLVAIAVVGVINVLPVLGVLGGSRLSAAYGIDMPSADVELLLRHRALLFGLVGGYVLYSLAAPSHRGAALTLAGLSMVGFVVLAQLAGEYGAALRKIVVADLVGIGALGIAAALHFVLPGRG